MRRLVAAGVVVLLAFSVAGCGGPQNKSGESHACDELQPLLDRGNLSPAETRAAVTAVHGWSSQVNGNDAFKAAGQAMYTAFQTSRQAEFDAAIADLRKQCADQ